MAKKAGAGLGILTDDQIIVESVLTPFDKLAEKYKIFIRSLFENGWNKTQAALAAGSKNPETARTSAATWLKRDDVKEAIASYKLKHEKANDLEVEDLKAELWKNHLKATRVSDSNKSLELLLRCMGAFKDTIELEGNMGFASVIADLKQTAKEISVEEHVKCLEAEILPDNGQSSPDNGSGLKLLPDNGE